MLQWSARLTDGLIRGSKHPSSSGPNQNSGLSRCNRDPHIFEILFYENRAPAL
jgi:hypothetical protein